MKFCHAGNFMFLWICRSTTSAWINSKRTAKLREPSIHHRLQQQLLRVPRPFYVKNENRRPSASSPEQNRNNNAHPATTLLQTCQAGLACGIASAFFFLSPANALVNELSPTTMTQSLSTQETSTATSRLQQLEQKMQMSSTGPSPFFTSSQFLLSSAREEQQGAMLDEVWTLIDKYYIDRTFHGQDWNKVKDIYQARLKSAGAAGGAADEMKIVRDMVQSLGDKYSRILDVQQYTAIQKYDLIGVGVTLMPNPQQEIIVGAPPIAGSPSDKAGLQMGDKVLAVNGMATRGKTAFDIIDNISDTPNLKTITMTIQSPSDGNEERQVVLERQFQEIKNPIRYRLTETRPDGTKVGYIRISEFNSLVKANLEDALRNLKQQGANAYVVDLRMNGGGAFQSAVEISSLFFEDRVATYVVDGTTTLLPFKSGKNQVLVDPKDPVVLWVDGGSASASEVFAASLHDNCRAVIMGEKSFGKGLIQAVYGLENGAGLVLTVARYVTPNQGEIQGVGIQPDISGKNFVPSAFLPGPLGSDTSKIDFSDISNRLSSKLCAVPEQL